MMTDDVKNLLLEKLDEWMEEVKDFADGEFVIGEATTSHMADAVELVWNSMGYSAKLQADLDEDHSIRDQLFPETD